MQQNGSFIRPHDLWDSVGLRADETVVHLGCGAGFYLIPAARIVGSYGKAIGYDILPDMLAEVENRARREQLEDIIKTKRVDLEKPEATELEPASINWVLVANILHQSDPAAILKEAVRIVADAGRVLVVEWDTAASPFGPPAASRIPKQDVIKVAESVGLALEKDFRPSLYHYGLVFKKT